MIRCTVKATGISPLIFSKRHFTPKIDGEKDDTFEERTWREKAHFDGDGKLYIPPATIKSSLNSTAKFLSRKIKGKQNATYTKHFEAGILVMNPMDLGIHKDQLESTRILCDSRGMKGGKGGGSQVVRIFPIIQEWNGEVTYFVLDPIIDEKIFEEHVVACGQFNGWGSFRAQNGGFCGRFKAEILKWDTEK